MKSIILVFFLTIRLTYALDDINGSSDIEKSYIDTAYDSIDTTVHELGVSIDSAILGIYDFMGGKPNRDEYNLSAPLERNVTDNNSSLLSLKQSDDENISDGNLSQKHIPLRGKTKSLPEPLAVEDKPPPRREIVDEFFLTRKLLEERDKSYVRVSYMYGLNSLERESNDVTIRAKLGLGRSKKRLKLFIEDLKEDSAKDIGKSGEEGSASIGVEVASKKRLGIRPRYSIGFRGIDPFVRARYSYETDFGRWHFEPVQTFLYSLKDEFSEITEFYLDTQVSRTTLLRFVIDRGTKSHINGMHYDGFIQYFWTPRKQKALSFNLGFNGSTRYQNTTVYSEPPVIVEENRVFNYLFVMRWRENFWKEWLFYEIAPGVNYHEVHDYRPNYNIFFRIDMFFGHV